MNDNFLAQLELHYDLLAEFQDHRDILDAFRSLPRDLKKYIQTFHKSERRVTWCPICGSGMYASAFAYHIPPFCQFTCMHNYQPIRRCRIEEE